MSNKYIFIFILIIYPIITAPSCKVGVNSCSKCDPLTQLCLRCDKDVFSPDKNGGCAPSGKCIIGNNYCQECNDDETICKVCEEGLFPDENGGCSLIANCAVSYKGKCLECKEDYNLVGLESEGVGFLICKSSSLEDFKHCNTINSMTGYCSECKEGYFLGGGDYKCTKLENCFESAMGICKKCISGYYLDKKNNKCKAQTGEFLFCKESVDGKTCDSCDDDRYFTDDDNCVLINHCSKGYYNKCEKCASGYSLSKDNLSCTKEKNCFNGDADNGLCNVCIDNYYIDLDDRKCKSNQEEDDFTNCRSVRNDACLTCAYGYILSKDSKCTKTTNCEEVENGECISCVEKYYLDLDNRCTLTEHCIHSTTYFECEECEDGYYFNYTNKLCVKEKKNFENCKSTDYGGQYCHKCKKNYYVNQTDHLCYSNKEKNDLYKCTRLDLSGEYCVSCENGYFYGMKDHKCSSIEGCEASETDKKCLECDEYHCLDVKTGKCEDNTFIKKEERKIYFRCNRTNEDGDKCEECLKGLELNDDGLCVETKHCIKEVDGVCKKCENNMKNTYCLNSVFGCVETIFLDCYECDDYLDFNKCTKCMEGYELNENFECMDIEVEE